MTTRQLLLKLLEKLFYEEWVGNQTRAKVHKSTSPKDAQMALASVPLRSLKRPTDLLARNRVRNLERIPPNAREEVMFLSSRRNGTPRLAAQPYRRTERRLEHRPDLPTLGIAGIRKGEGTKGRLGRSGIRDRVRTTATIGIATETDGGMTRMAMTKTVLITQDGMTAIGTEIRPTGAPGATMTAEGTGGMAIDERTDPAIANGKRTATAIATMERIDESDQVECSLESACCTEQIVPCIRHYGDNT